eukprot:jgi/Ulvmu1/8267/UM041_0078.1
MSFYVYAWLGVSSLVNPILDFIYSFCNGPAAWAVAWLACPAEHAHLDFTTLGRRVTALRAKSTSSKPASVVAQLASLATSAVEPEAKSLYANAATLTGEAAIYFESQVFRPTLAQLATASAHQYDGLVRANLVLSTLPTQSSLPTYTPNFVDSTK